LDESSTFGLREAVSALGGEPVPLVPLQSSPSVSSMMPPKPIMACPIPMPLHAQTPAQAAIQAMCADGVAAKAAAHDMVANGMASARGRADKLHAQALETQGIAKAARAAVLQHNVPAKEEHQVPPKLQWSAPSLNNNPFVPPTLMPQSNSFIPPLQQQIPQSSSFVPPAQVPQNTSFAPAGQSQSSSWVPPPLQHCGPQAAASPMVVPVHSSGLPQSNSYVPLPLMATPVVASSGSYVPMPQVPATPVMWGTGTPAATPVIAYRNPNPQAQVVNCINREGSMHQLKSGPPRSARPQFAGA